MKKEILFLSSSGSPLVMILTPGTFGDGQRHVVVTAWVGVGMKEAAGV